MLQMKLQLFLSLSIFQYILLLLWFDNDIAIQIGRTMHIIIIPQYARRQ